MDEQEFIHTVAEQLNVEKEQAKKIVSAVFHELHDRLTLKEANDAAAQLPEGLKSLWRTGDYPGREVKRTHKPQFLRSIAEHAEIPESEATHATRVVFKALQTVLHSTSGMEGEAWDIFSQLPKDLKKVWVAAAKPQPAKRV